jgi:uncharacterized protein GlcG (DUF336 family)
MTQVSHELVAERRTLTLAGAKAVAAEAEKIAADDHHAVCVAVVDDSGNLLFFQRPEGVPSASIAAAIAKARTAAEYRCPTKALQNIADGGSPAMVTLRGALMLEGGEPLLAGGEIVGAIGVSGVTGPLEGEIARAAAAWLR